MNDILYEDNHIIVVNKKINVPVQGDSSKDLDLLTIIKKYLKEKYNKPNNVYLGLIHRLDRPVGGVMVFAKTSKAASRLSKQVSNHEFEKIYHAVVVGKMNDSGEFIDKITKNQDKNISYIDPNGKLCILNYELVNYNNNLNLSLVKISLKTGRSHQIRVQFSSRNHPLYGDQKYNKKAVPGEQLALMATTLSFYHPITKEKLTFSIPLPDDKIWKK